MKFWTTWEYVVSSPRGKWHWEPVGITTTPRKLRRDLPEWRRKFVRFQPIAPIKEVK